MKFTLGKSLGEDRAQIRYIRDLACSEIRIDAFFRRDDVFLLYIVFNVVDSA